MSPSAAESARPGLEGDDRRRGARGLEGVVRELDVAEERLGLRRSGTRPPTAPARPASPPAGRRNAPPAAPSTAPSADACSVTSSRSPGASDSAAGFAPNATAGVAESRARPKDTSNGPARQVRDDDSCAGRASESPDTRPRAIDVGSTATSVAVAATGSTSPAPSVVTGSLVERLCGADEQALECARSKPRPGFGHESGRSGDDGGGGARPGCSRHALAGPGVGGHEPDAGRDELGLHVAVEDEPARGEGRHAPAPGLATVPAGPSSTVTGSPAASEAEAARAARAGSATTGMGVASSRSSASRRDTRPPATRTAAAPAAAALRACAATSPRAGRSTARPATVLSALAVEEVAQLAFLPRSRRRPGRARRASGRRGAQPGRSRPPAGATAPARSSFAAKSVLVAGAERDPSRARGFAARPRRRRSAPRARPRGLRRSRTRPGRCGRRCRLQRRRACRASSRRRPPAPPGCRQRRRTARRPAASAISAASAGSPSPSGSTARSRPASRTSLVPKTAN